MVTCDKDIIVDQGRIGNQRARSGIKKKNGLLTDNRKILGLVGIVTRRAPKTPFKSLQYSSW